MKALQVHDFYAPGNSRFGFEQCKLLVSRGHSAHVLCCTGNQGPYDGAILSNILFHTMERPELKGYKFANYMFQNFGERITKLNRFFKYHIIMFNQPLSSYACFKYGEIGAAKTIYFFHSPWAREWRLENPNRWFLARLFHEMSRRKMEDFVLKRVDAVMVASEYMKRILHEEHPDVPDSKIYVVGGVVNDEVFIPRDKEYSRERFGIPKDKFVVCTLRRMVRRMGLEHLVSAMEVIQGKMKDTLLIMGGDGPLRKQLELMCLEKGVRSAFTGYVSDEDISYFYSASDLFVIPTIDLEGFGLVIGEAMACGLPVIGTPVGAIPEVMEPLSKDLLLKSATVEGIVEGIEKFRSGQLSFSSTRDYAINRFGTTAFLKRFMTVIETICPQALVESIRIR